MPKTIVQGKELIAEQWTKKVTEKLPEGAELPAAVARLG